MLFPTVGFLVFFLFVAALMPGLERHFAIKKVLLVAASYFFYAQWNWRFCFLLGFSTAVSYAAGLAIAASRDPARRRAFLIAGSAVHLGVLGLFKYFDFFVESANELAHALGLQRELPFFEIILPVGISFYTFHGISYITDVYRGRCRSVPETGRHAALHVILPAAGRRADRARLLFFAAARKAGRRSRSRSPLRLF